MTYLCWNDAFNVGDAMIDGDHRNLFRLIDEIRALSEQGGEDSAVHDLLDRLIEVTGAHLQREEVFMQRIGYTDFSTHRHHHDKLIETVRSLQKRLDAEDSNPDTRNFKSMTRIHGERTDSTAAA